MFSSLPMRFVVPLVLLVLALACGHAPPAPRPHRPGPHLQDAWFAARGEALGIPEPEARRRDAALAEGPPSEAIWDEQLAAEASALWGRHCAVCHGARGRLEGVPPAEPRPRAWGGFGAKMGFFFGGDKMRRGLFRRIAEGGAPRDGRPSRMPAWRGALSNEQIWGLVHFIERL